MRPVKVRNAAEEVSGLVWVMVRWRGLVHLEESNFDSGERSALGGMSSWRT